MSSRVNAKVSKRDKDGEKSKGRLRRDGGTPEYGLMPKLISSDASTEHAFDKRNALLNDEILGMQITDENLKQLHQSADVKPCDKSNMKGILVRKQKKDFDKKQLHTTLLVAKAAPADVETKPVDLTTVAGPRFTKDGLIIPHSILGSVENFKRQAVAHGDLPAAAVQNGDSAEATELTVKYEKSKKKYPIFKSAEKSNALVNWEKRMEERRKQQDFLHRHLKKEPHELVMNQSDAFRQTQEKRYAIDRTMPSVDYGKGFRVGSEFWQQRENIGNSLRGLHMTLTQTERGYPPPVEHVGVPNYIKLEKGSNWNLRTAPKKPWHNTQYFQDRMEQMEPIWRELDPYSPDMEHLEIVGSPRRADSTDTNANNVTKSITRASTALPLDDEDDPLSGHPDVRSDPIVGPAIRFDGQPARWTGVAKQSDTEVGVEARVTFEAFANQRNTAHLEIVNEGTTAINYTWKKEPQSNPFDLVNANVQRFYFNTSGGVILPGDTMCFPFVFKSQKAGVFREQWTFQTCPTLMGGAKLVVTLRGVALQEDKFSQQRDELEMELAHRQAEQIVGEIVDQLVDGIRTPDRPGSPVDRYISEEQVFCRRNRGLEYFAPNIDKLGTMYEEMTQSAVQNWDMSVDVLKREILLRQTPPESEEDAREAPLKNLNDAVATLSFPHHRSRQDHMLAIAHAALAEAVDEVVYISHELRYALGMPEREIHEVPEEVPDKRVSPVKDKKLAKEDTKKPPKEDKKAKVKEKEKTPKTPVKKEQTRPKTASSQLSGGRITPVANESARMAADPILDVKYREKLFTGVYNTLSEAVDKISVSFSVLGNVKPLTLS